MAVVQVELLKLLVWEALMEPCEAVGVWLTVTVLVRHRVVVGVSVALTVAVGVWLTVAVLVGLWVVVGVAVALPVLVALMR